MSGLIRLGNFKMLPEAKAQGLPQKMNERILVEEEESQTRTTAYLTNTNGETKLGTA